MHWSFYVVASIMIFSCTFGIVIIDHLIAIKKEKNKMSKKTVLDMLLDGWCDGCDCDPAQCQAAGRCLAEEDNTNDEEKSV